MIRWTKHNLCKLLVFFSISGFVSCQGQETKEVKLNKKDTTMTEKFDFNIYEKTDHGSIPYTKSDGNEIYMMDFDKKGGFQYERYPSPSFLTVYKEFYANGNLKLKETYIGEHVKVGISRYYDDRGNLLKEVNEDQKFGKIKPQQVLEFLQEKGYIDLKTGKGRIDEEGDRVFGLSFDQENGKKIWTIGIIKGKPNDDPANFPDIGEPPAFLPLDYIMDGETGKVTKEDSHTNKDKKETPAVYKTYKGKNYTEEQWKVFEQELFEIYARKHNIPLAKNDKKNSSGRTFQSLFEDEDTKKENRSGFKFLGDD